MKKNFLLLLIGVTALLSCITGIPELLDGIRERGAGGVNYGRVIFPLLIGGVALWRYVQCRKSEG